MFRRLWTGRGYIEFYTEELYKMIRYGGDYFKIDLLFHVYVYIYMYRMISIVQARHKNSVERFFFF